MKGVRCGWRGRHRQKEQPPWASWKRRLRPVGYDLRRPTCALYHPNQGTQKWKSAWISKLRRQHWSPARVSHSVITHQAHESDVTCGVGTASWRASHHASPCSSGRLSFSVPCHPWSLYLRFLLPLAEFQSFLLPYNPSHFFKLCSSKPMQISARRFTCGTTKLTCLIFFLQLNCN